MDRVCRGSVSRLASGDLLVHPEGPVPWLGRNSCCFLEMLESLRGVPAFKHFNDIYSRAFQGCPMKSCAKKVCFQVDKCHIQIAC